MAKAKTKTKKITEEHLEQLNKLETNKKVLIEELGKIALQEILIEKRRDSAESFLDALNEQEKTLGQALQDFYGQGTIDLPNKVFIPKE